MIQSSPPIAPTTAIRRLFVLLCGYEILPKSISTRDRGRRFILSEPVCVYLLDTANGWVLLDAGLNPANARDPARMQDRFWRFGMTAPVLRDAHLLDRQLRDLGLTYTDIGHVILSHLHYDHCGCLREFAHARISIQRREHQHAFGADPGAGYFRDEYDDPRLRWELHSGDWDAMPGLRLLDTRGHTQGHQSAVVTLPHSGALILPFDAADLRENWEESVLPGESCDDEAAARALRRLQSLDGTVLFFHDPVAIQQTTLAPDSYS